MSKGNPPRIALLIIVGVLAAAGAIWLWRANRVSSRVADEEKAGAEGYVGSKSCRECHERFYKLWSTSYHGLAMQP